MSSAAANQWFGNICDYFFGHTMVLKTATTSFSLRYSPFWELYSSFRKGAGCCIYASVQSYRIFYITFLVPNNASVKHVVVQPYNPITSRLQPYPLAEIEPGV